MSSSPEYQRGYRAGRKRTEDEMEKSRLEWDEMFSERLKWRRQALSNVMAGMVSSGRTFNLDGKTITHTDDLVTMAARIVHALERKAFQ